MKAYEFEIQNDHGLHARPASMLIQTLNKFQSAVSLFKEGQKYNGKSMLNIMKMAAAKGDVILVEASGDDEELCIEAVKSLVLSGFGE